MIVGHAKPWWPKYSKKKNRKSHHYEDPIMLRVCGVCGKDHRWKLSDTANGKEMMCRCGAVFCSWNNPSWRVP